MTSNFYTGRPFEKSATAPSLIYKSVQFVAKDVTASGKVLATVNTLGVKDLQGDRMMPGCWRAITEKMVTGQMKYPTILVGHNWELPVGKVRSAWESIDGSALMIEGQFNLDTQRGKESFSDVRKGLVGEWSVGFLPGERRYEGDAYNVYDVADWPEVSIVLRGASPNTRTLETKSLYKPDDDIDEELVMQLVLERLKRPREMQPDDRIESMREPMGLPSAWQSEREPVPFNPMRGIVADLYDNPVNENSMAGFLNRVSAGLTSLTGSTKPKP